MRAAGCVTFSWLVDGELTRQWSRNLGLSQKSPSSTWAGALVPIEELKDIVMYIPWRGTRTLPQAALWFLDSSSLVSASPPFPIKHLNLPFGTQGRSRKLNETYFLKASNRGHRKALCLGGPHMVLHSLIPSMYVVKLLFDFFPLICPMSIYFLDHSKEPRRQRKISSSPTTTNNKNKLHLCVY